jgi:hypothetical protein
MGLIRGVRWAFNNGAIEVFYLTPTPLQMRGAKRMRWNINGNFVLNLTRTPL